MEVGAGATAIRAVRGSLHWEETLELRCDDEKKLTSHTSVGRTFQKEDTASVNALRKEQASSFSFFFFLKLHLSKRRVAGAGVVGAGRRSHQKVISSK